MPWAILILSGKSEIREADFIIVRVLSAVEKTD